MNFTQFPRQSYVEYPTPIEHLPALSRALDDKVNLFVKRDDLLPGAGGGNKTRKLEFCIADALEQGADSIITCGAIQSNHCRLTLSWAVKEGLDCHLVLEERVKGTYNENAGGNNFLYQLMGVAGITLVQGGSDMMAAMQDKADQLKSAGKKPYIIPGGASNAIGALGYAACAQETMVQLNDGGLDIDHIIVPSGSAGTHAGMLTGLIGTNANIPLSGINVSRDKTTQEALVYDLTVETCRKLNLCRGPERSEVVCHDRYVGPGYSLPTDSMVEAVTLFARTESILLDPVYSGKAAAGLIDLVRKDHFEQDANILFLHTGGSPALFVYMDAFRNSPFFKAGI